MTLIDRLSKLDGPDREVDREIAKIDPGPKPSMIPFDYTASVDAAIALAARVLPGWTFEHIGQDYIRSMGASDDLMPIGWNVEITDGLAVIQGQGPTFPLAICIAILRAKEASHGQ